ncbi:MAG: tail fiber domain-containing protein [Thermoanaerobaculia bacterium]
MNIRHDAVRTWLLASAFALTGVAAHAQLATRSFPGGVDFAVDVAFHHAVLTVSMPDGRVEARTFTSGQKPSFELAGANGGDGAYTWRIEVFPGATASRASGGVDRGGEPSWSSTGSFAVLAGAVVPTVEEARPGPVAKPAPQSSGRTSLDLQDQVIPDDLIVQGSACVGLDCVNNESFGFDTIRLKENNLRIKFDDTSVGTFPANDWELTANDSASGGASRFSILDVTASRNPFTVRAGARADSIFVDGSGRVGFGTTVPVLFLHERTGDTPALRFEQDGSGGFTPQTWDIAGNEANFFVRDVTGGSRLPFRIRPGAPTSSVDISASGNVGIGTASPSTNLHVAGSAGTTKALIQETSATNAARELLELQNNGQVALIFEDTSVPERWTNTASSTFIINNQNATGIEFRLANNGDLTIAGMLTTGSSRDVKRDIEPVDAASVLDRVASLPVSTWRYRSDESGALHLGPMAQDFRAAFGLGADDSHLAPGDVAGVSLAAIQALHHELAGRDAEMAALAAQNRALALRLAHLEERIQRLTGP